MTEGLLKVDWPYNRRFQAGKPGIKFAPIPNADPPADKARARTLQIKALKDRFSGRLNVNTEKQGGAETRFMARPLFEYSEPDSQLPRGGIFGMTSTGTNPDLLLIIEARPDENGKLRWEHAHARMTSATLVVRLDDVEVWSEGSSPANNTAPENWIYYFMEREFK